MESLGGMGGAEEEVEEEQDTSPMGQEGSGLEKPLQVPERRGVLGLGLGVGLGEKVRSRELGPSCPPPSLSGGPEVT